MIFKKAMLLEEMILSLDLQLQDDIIRIIKYDLMQVTINNNKKSYTEEEIDDFICRYVDEILDCIEKMIKDYKEAGTLDKLENVPDEWIKEYLYQYITYENINKS